MNRFFFNHVGVERAHAEALVRCDTGEPLEVEILDTAGEVVKKTVTVDQGETSFRGLKLARIPLHDLPSGRYALRTGEETSAPFFIEDKLLPHRVLPAVLSYEME